MQRDHLQNDTRPGFARTNLGEHVGSDALRSARAMSDRGQRLIAVNRYFYPDISATSQLLTDLVAAMTAKGFATTVLTGRRHYVDTDVRLPTRERFLESDVRRIWHAHCGRSSLGARALDDLSFCVSAFVALVVMARRGDIILAMTDPPLLPVVCSLAARLRGACLVNWCQDLFPETAAAMGLAVAKGYCGRALRGLRNAALRYARRNVVISNGMAMRLRDEGIPRARIAVIHNWADGDAIRPVPTDQNRLRRAWGLEGKFVIGYSGNLGPSQEIDAVVELMAALGHERDIVFLFVGAGRCHGRLRAAIAERGVTNAMFEPYQARERLSQSLTAPDLHLVTLRLNWDGTVMPSKLYGALAAGRPVIFIGNPGGDVARIVTDSIGVVAAPDAMAALADRIRDLRRDPVRLLRMGAEARHVYDVTFNREASLRAWAHCLQGATSSARAVEVQHRRQLG